MTDYMSPFAGRYGGWNFTDPAWIVEGFANRDRLDAAGREMFTRLHEDMVEYTRLFRDPKTRASVPEYMGGAD